ALVLNDHGKVIKARRRIRMLRPERFLADCQRALMKPPRRGKITLGSEDDSKLIKAQRHVGMRKAERLLPDRNRALLELLRPRKVAQVGNQTGQTAEARRRLGMLRAQFLLPDRNRVLVEGCSLQISAAPMDVEAHSHEKVGPFRIRSSREGFLAQRK